MTAQSDKSSDGLIASVLTAPVLPARVREDVARQQDRSEQIISVVQIAIVLIFGGLFLLAPGGGNTELAFELTPLGAGRVSGLLRGALLGEL